MNVLLTCVGRRGYLAQFFKAALGARGRVIACDSSAIAPGLLEADRQFVVPPMDHPEYYDALLELCREQNVRLLFSVNDLELGGLAEHAGRFRAAGTLPVLARPDTIAICQDKWASFRFLRTAKISTPHTYLDPSAAVAAVAQGIVEFPLLVKPRWGTSSIGVELVENERELALAFEWGKVHVRRTILAKLSQTDPENCLIVQERVQGQEYGLDIVNDLEGNYVATLARRKLAMRAGNTDRAVTVSEPRLARLGKALGQRLQHIGCLDCDVVDSDQGCVVLDLNPRFGGGYPFSHLAGANLPAALIAWANREEPDPTWLVARPGVLASKCDHFVIMSAGRRQDEAYQTCGASVES
jgi:carbamoyl-phosphate synthase large subunit